MREFRFTILFSVVLAAGACGCGGAVGERCSLDSDCQDGLICSVDTCRRPVPTHDSGAPPTDTGSPVDSGVDSSVADTSPPLDSGDGCDLGTATSSATATNASLFGERVPFAGDRDIPAAMYQLEYVDGCFKYADSQGWTINARDTGITGWHLVGATAAAMEPFQLLPGTVGIYAGEGAYADFEECVAANLVVPPITIDHAGGPLGIWLHDGNYSDNVAGQDGRNPEWRLVAVDCVP